MSEKKPEKKQSAIKRSRIPVLACSKLSVGYKDRAVLSGLDLVVERGHFVTLLGPNGAGKTTLLRTLSRHLTPISGGVAIEGRDLSAYTAGDLAKVMAVVLTEKVSPPLFTVAEFVALGRYPHTDFLGRLGPADHAAVNQALAAVRAEALARRPFADLSDGERQKALVARALAQQPRLMLLDEPTVHLDLKHRMEVMTILRDLCRMQGITVIASLHDVDVAAKVSDRVALVKNGVLADWGAPETVLTGRAVADLYDFEAAEFNSDLGGIELRGDGCRGRAFVVAGMGRGAQIYRLLAKNSFAITTGVLHTNDLDYYVARSLGAVIEAHKPMEPISDNIAAATVEQLAQCDMVIDCGFQLGSLNQGNATLLCTALEKGLPVFSLRREGLEQIWPQIPKNAVIRCESPVQLMEALDRHFPLRPVDQPSAAPVMEAL
jgi:iron complex transport system ATP-binding protein